MSNSRRKSPVMGWTTAESESAWKAQVARRTRRMVRQTLGETLDGDALPEKRYALTDPLDGPKDGKQRLRGAAERHFRK
jgi:hypothetical protein